MPFAQTETGTRIYYDRSDPTTPNPQAASAVILLNHLSTNRLMWAPVLEEASRRGLTALAVDARGCGRSDAPAGRWKTSDLAADVISVLDDAGIEDAHICGISLGGCVAQEISLRYPHRTRSLILMATTSNGTVPGAMSQRELARITTAQLRTAAPRDTAAQRLLTALTTRAFAPTAPQTPAWPLVHKVLDEPTPRIGTLKQLSAGTTHSTAKRLGKIAAPTLVLHGTADRLFPVAAARRMASRIPGARFEPLEGLGHGLIFQSPELCTNHILDFAIENSNARRPA